MLTVESEILSLCFQLQRYVGTKTGTESQTWPKENISQTDSQTWKRPKHASDGPENRHQWCRPFSFSPLFSQHKAIDERLAKGCLASFGHIAGNIDAQRKMYCRSKAVLFGQICRKCTAVPVLENYHEELERTVQNSEFHKKG